MSTLHTGRRSPSTKVWSFPPQLIVQLAHAEQPTKLTLLLRPLSYDAHLLRITIQIALRMERRGSSAMVAGSRPTSGPTLRVLRTFHPALQTVPAVEGSEAAEAAGDFREAGTVDVTVGAHGSHRFLQHQ